MQPVFRWKKLGHGLWGRFSTCRAIPCPAGCKPAPRCNLRLKTKPLGQSGCLLLPGSLAKSESATFLRKWRTPFCAGNRYRQITCDPIADPVRHSATWPASQPTSTIGDRLVKLAACVTYDMQKTPMTLRILGIRRRTNRHYFCGSSSGPIPRSWAGMVNGLPSSSCHACFCLSVRWLTIILRAQRSTVTVSIIPAVMASLSS